MDLYDVKIQVGKEVTTAGDYIEENLGRVKHSLTTEDMSRLMRVVNGYVDAVRINDIYVGKYVPTFFDRIKDISNLDKLQKITHNHFAEKYQYEVTLSWGDEIALLKEMADDLQEACEKWDAIQEEMKDKLYKRREKL